MYTNRLQPCMLHPAACRVFLCLCLCFIAYMPDLQAKTLSRRQCAQLARQLRSEWADSVRRAMADSHAQRVIVRDAGPMRLHWTVFGDAPADGRSLFISLHGGGGAPPQLNDAQWQNQWQLYQPAEGVYLCPRPPFNTWDLHFRPELDEYYADLIRMMVVCEGVNPDKVYVMGYSAGGDGVWRLAPRLADRWAAASMMAFPDPTSHTLKANICSMPKLLELRNRTKKQRTSVCTMMFAVDICILLYRVCPPPARHSFSSFAVRQAAVL